MPVMSGAKREQWTRQEATDWYGDQPWLVGCNYIPSNAINQLEMWQAETFDSEINERELGWAAGLGMNTVRVYLHDLPWAHDAEGFLGRIDRFLAIASRLGIRPMFVFFDSVWDPHPQPGPQRAVRPGVHNSGWVQSPGANILAAPLRHAELEGYVRGVISAFGDDERVLAWDLFNEPDNPNPSYAKQEIPDKAAMAMALLTSTFGWARAAAPRQPLTSGVWSPQWVRTGEESAMEAFQLGESDVLSFHAYAPPHKVEQRIAGLKEYEKPLFLTEYLARPYDNRIENVLPLAKRERVAAFNWGLVAGKTQTIYPWESWVMPGGGEPDEWFHDLLRSDGLPYREEEQRFLREIVAAR